MYDVAVPQCIVCCDAALPSLCEKSRTVVHMAWNGWRTWYNICGGCIRLSWKDATKLEPECQSWEDIDDKCNEWSVRLLNSVARRHCIPENEVSWA